MLRVLRGLRRGGGTTPSGGTRGATTQRQTRITDEEAAQAADGQQQFIASEDTARPISQETPAGVNPHPTYQDMGYGRRLGADVAGRAAEQPGRVARGIHGAAKVGAVGGVAATGLWAGNNAWENYTAMQMAESQEAIYEEYMAGVEEIRNDDSLTPDQKQEAIEHLTEMYETAIANPDAPDGPLGSLGGSVSNWIGDLGVVEKLIGAILLVVLIRAAAEVKSA